MVEETRLGKYLKDKGIKKKWLADQAGISQATMSNLTLGKSEPTLQTARKIAKILGVAIEELWPEDE